MIVKLVVGTAPRAIAWQKSKGFAAGEKMAGAVGPTTLVMSCGVPTPSYVLLFRKKLL